MIRRSTSALLVLVLMATMARSPLGQTMDTTRRDQDVVTLSRGGCRDCPAYTVMIDGSGHVQFTYQGLRPHPWSNGTLRRGDVFSATADPQQVADLFRQIDRDGFFEMGQNWTSHGPNCSASVPDIVSTASVSVAMGARRHMVMHDAGCRDAPAALGVIETNIDKVANVGRWLHAP